MTKDDGFKGSVHDVKGDGFGVVARCDEGDVFGGKRNGGELLTVECVYCNLMSEGSERNLKPECKSVVHEITFSPRVQKCSTVVKVRGPSELYREESRCG